MKLALAFLCYNQSSAPYLPAFLASLERALKPVKDELLILAGDNSDCKPFDNQEIINKHNLNSDLSIKLLVFGRNLGFAAAYNRLIAAAKKEGADYFLMINPDMLLAEDAVVRLWSTLSEYPDLAVVCPKIYRWDFINNNLTNIIDSCGIALSSGLRFYDLGQGEEDKGQCDVAEIIGPSGAAAIFRISSLEKIKEGDNYFDERFFMYKEDCDLAYRLYQAGQKTMLAPKAIAYHDRSSAGQKGLWQTWLHWRRRSRLSRSWSFVNQHLIFIKYFRYESLFSRFLILFKVLFLFLFSLILAQFLLKSYYRIWHLYHSID